jgi:dTDP-4-dehydrorhamnose reductase
MRVLITGVKGQLGAELVRALDGRAEVIGRDLPEFDVATPDCATDVAAIKAERVIHAAAATDVDGCERDPGMAMAVNAEGTRRVADGEQAVRETAPRWVIARTAWLYGAHGRNFVKTILGNAAAGKPVRVVDDQVGSPTYARDLAGALVRVLERNLNGVFHLTNSGSCSWFDFTREILRQGGFGHVPVSPMNSEELGRPARRPAFSVLANKAWRAAGEPVLRPWPEALTDMLRAWRAVDPAFPMPTR